MVNYGLNCRCMPALKWCQMLMHVMPMVFQYTVIYIMLHAEYK